MTATAADADTDAGRAGTVVVGAGGAVVTVGAVAFERVVDAAVGVVAAARGADVVGGAGVAAPTGRQIDRPGTSTESTDASFTARRSARSTSAASAMRIQ